MPNNENIIHHDFRKEQRTLEKMNNFFVFATLYKRDELGPFLKKKPSERCFSEEEIELYCLIDLLLDEHLHRPLPKDNLFEKMDKHIWDCHRCLAFYTKINIEWEQKNK